MRIFITLGLLDSIFVAYCGVFKFKNAYSKYVNFCKSQGENLQLFLILNDFLTYGNHDKPYTRISICVSYPFHCS